MAYDISTLDASNILSNSFLSGGYNVDVSGGTTIAKGLVYKVGTGDPSLNDNSAEYFYGDDGDFTLGIYSLDPSVQYSFRAFLLFEDPSLIVYGDTKTAITAQETVYYSPVCTNCYWFNRLIDASGLITKIRKDDNNPWHCAAFPESEGYSIPENIKTGDFAHDVSIEDQYFVNIFGEDYYPIFAANPAADIIPVTKILNLPDFEQAPDAAVWVPNEIDLSTYWDNIDEGVKYIMVPSIKEGTNVTFDYHITETSGGYSLIDTITVNATGTLGVAKSYVDASLAKRDVSIAWLNSYRVVQDVSIAAAGNFKPYVDGSLATRDVSIAWNTSKNIQQDASLNNTLDASLLFQSILTLETKTGTSAGVPGQWSYDASYFYICTSTNIWRRTLMSSF